MWENLLQEIGEFFGGVRDSYGRQQNFRQQILAKRGLNDFNQLQNPQIPPPNTNPFLDGPSCTDFSQSRYYGWQKKVIKTLEEGKDVYVCAPPGGGKTTPLMAYWYVDIFCRGKNADFKQSFNPTAILGTPNRNTQSFQAEHATLKLETTVIDLWANIFRALLTGKYLDGSDVKKILFITPIRVLSFEQAEGFQKFFLDLIVFLESLFQQLPSPEDLFGNNNNLTLSQKLNTIRDWNGGTVPGHIIAKSFAATKVLSGEDMDKVLMTFYNVLLDEAGKKTNLDKFNIWAKKFTQNIICVKTGGGSGDFNSNQQSTLVTISTFGAAENFIENYIKEVKFVVFDEAHVYQPSKFNGDSSEYSSIVAARGCYTILHAALKNQETQVAFLSGTINPISAQKFADFINLRYRRHVELCKTEPGDPEAKNKTELRIMPADFLMDLKSTADEAAKWIRTNQTGNCIVLFSKLRIIELTEEIEKRVSPSSLQSVNERGKNDRQKQRRIEEYKRALKYAEPHLSKTDLEYRIENFINREFPESQTSKINRILNKPGAAQIENPHLREAVSYGVGYIFTQDDALNTAEEKARNIMAVNENDKLIVADLFSSGKINVLLATPAIGIGVNVSIKNMYLPTLTKPEGTNKPFETERKLLNRRELSQLLNRTGRGKIAVSGIYVPNEFVEYVRSTTLMNTTDFENVPAISIDKNDKLINVIMKLRESVSKEAYEKFMQKHTSTASTVHGVSNILNRSSNWILNQVVKLRQRSRGQRNITNLNIQVSRFLDGVLGNKFRHDLTTMDRLITQSERLNQEYLTRDNFEGNLIIPSFDRFIDLCHSYKKQMDDYLYRATQEINNVSHSADPNRQALLDGLETAYVQFSLLSLRVDKILLLDYTEGIRKLETNIQNPNNNLTQDEVLNQQNIKRNLQKKYPFLASTTKLRQKINSDINFINAELGRLPTFVIPTNNYSAQLISYRNDLNHALGHLPNITQ